MTHKTSNASLFGYETAPGPSGRLDKAASLENRSSVIGNAAARVLAITREMTEVSAATAPLKPVGDILQSPQNDESFVKYRDQAA